MAVSRHILLILWLLAGTGMAQAADEFVVTEISFLGNEITKPAILLQEIDFQVGDRITLGKVNKARQAIMDLQLFKLVEYTINDTFDGKAITFILQERFYFLPIPRLDAKEAKDFTYGIEIITDNIMGLNQRLKYAYLYKESLESEIPLRKEVSLEYKYPRIFFSRFLLSTKGSIERERQELDYQDQISIYRKDSRDLSFSLGLWLEQEARSRGWRGVGGIHLRQEHYEHEKGLENGLHNSQALGLTYGLINKRVHEYRYYRHGLEFGYRGEMGLTMFASDYSYHRNLFYYTRYKHMDNNDNFNAQLKLAIANGWLFDRVPYSLGGSGSLRGYESDTLQGNNYLTLRMEYLHPLMDDSPLRGVAFWDMGSAAPDLNHQDMLNVKNALGLGIRRKITSLINIYLNLDAAYGVDSKRYFFYFRTSATF